MNAESVVYLVEDDDAVRESLSLVLKAAGFSVEAFASAEGFLQTGFSEGFSEGPTCLVLDIRLPAQSGLDLQETIGVKGANIPIVFITGHGDVPMARRALRSGAIDFIQKPIDDTVLIAAVQQALGKSHLAQEDAKVRAELEKRLKTLTPRERDVMDLVVTGAPNKTVASELGISPRTVEIYRRKVMEKMRAETLPDLVRLAERIVRKNTNASA